MKSPKYTLLLSLKGIKLIPFALGETTNGAHDNSLKYVVSYEIIPK